MDLPVMPPLAPMLAKAIDALPDRDDIEFEPKWDGFRCIVFRDRDEVELWSRNERPLTRYFPEIVDPLRSSLPRRCVVDGELVIATSHGLDFDLLSQRIHPAESRVDMLASTTPASFVGFDLLALDDRPLLDVPFGDRRRLLEESTVSTRPPVFVTPASTDRHLAADWFARFEGAGLDGVMVKPLDGRYTPGKRSQFKVKHRRTADCVVGGYRVHKSGDGVGSLLLGLYDAEGVLHHMGVASSFSADLRRELVDDLKPFSRVVPGEHPWHVATPADAVDPSEATRGRLPGAPSRWTGTKDLSWVPIDPELVAEVAYDHLQAGRFRHSTHLLRLRPDRRAETCTFDQLERVPPYELTKIFGA